MKGFLRKTPKSAITALSMLIATTITFLVLSFLPIFKVCVSRTPVPKHNCKACGLPAAPIVECVDGLNFWQKVQLEED